MITASVALEFLCCANQDAAAGRGPSRLKISKPRPYKGL